MATGQLKWCRWTLILFVSIFPLVKVEQAGLLNHTFIEFSEADNEDNVENVNEAISLIGSTNKDKNINMMKISDTAVQLGKNKTEFIMQKTNHEKNSKMNETIESPINKELPASLYSQLNNKATENSSQPEMATVKNDSGASNYSIENTTLVPKNGTPTENFSKELSTTENSSIQMDHLDHLNISEKTGNIKRNDSDQNEHFVKSEESIHLSSPLPLNDEKLLATTSYNLSKILDDITYSTTESSRTENYSKALKLNTSKNLDKKISNLSVVTTEIVINSLTEERPNNSEQWDSHNKNKSINSLVQPTTSVVQSTIGIKEEYTATYPTVYSPPLAKFILHSDFQEDPCMAAAMGIKISIQCEHSSNKMKSYNTNVPENANVSGSCDIPQMMTISWLDEFNNTFALTLKSSLIVPESESLEREGESISITEVSLKMKLDSKGFPEDLTLGDTYSASNLNLFKSPVNQVYLSQQTQLLKLEAHHSKTCPVTLTFADVQFQAYISSHDKATESMLEKRPNSTMTALFISAPVGLLGILVVISFVIYKRKRLHPGHRFSV